MVLIIDLLKNLFKKPFTVAYPNGKLEVNNNVRSKLNYNCDTCISDYSCIKVCPANAIRVNSENKKIIIDLGKCVFCGNCVAVCPTKSLYFTNEFELAVYDRNKLIIK